MEKNVIDEVIARRFLLGQLSAEERQRVEELAFADPDTFASLQAAQDDLIDDFLSDELSPDEKDRFENYFLSQPGRRQDLRISRALRQYLARDEPSVPDATPNVFESRPKATIFDWFRLHPATVSVAALILVVLLGLIVLIRMRRSEDPLMQAQQQPTPALPTPSISPAVTPAEATPSPTQKQDQSTPAPSPRRAPAPVYAVLVPGSPARSEGEETKIAPVPAPITFELPLVDNTPYDGYRAQLQRDGRTILDRSNLQPGELQAGRGIKLDVPAGVLENRQRYRIVLSGISANAKAQPVHHYYFHVSN